MSLGVVNYELACVGEKESKPTLKEASEEEPFPVSFVRSVCSCLLHRAVCGSDERIPAPLRPHSGWRKKIMILKRIKRAIKQSNYLSIIFEAFRKVQSNICAV